MEGVEWNREEELRVLVTNDDGIEAAGLLALESALREAGFEVTAAAPDQERSGSSHSVSLRKPLRMRELGGERYAVSGTPVDAVHIAVNHILRGKRPALVISGINRGANLGCDIHYSGTVSAAREGAILGVPSLAISLETDKEDPDFGNAARFACFLAEFIREHGLPERTFLNVNLPDLPEAEIKGVQVTAQGVRQYDNIIQRRPDENGDSAFWLGGMPQGGARIPGSDIVAVDEGYISVTPLRLDLTREDALGWLTERLSDQEGRSWK